MAGPSRVISAAFSSYCSFGEDICPRPSISILTGNTSPRGWAATLTRVGAKGTREEKASTDSGKLLIRKYGGRLAGTPHITSPSSSPVPQSPHLPGSSVFRADASLQTARADANALLIELPEWEPPLPLGQGTHSVDERSLKRAWGE